MPKEPSVSVRRPFQFHALDLSFCKFLSILIFFLSATEASSWCQNGMQPFSPEDHFRFRQITVDNGLSQNMITSLCQDRKGYIWIGTRDGLNLFDGNHFTVFKYEPSDSFPLLENYITAIYEDPGEHLWVGTYTAGLFYFERETRRFIHFSSVPGNENSLTDNHIKTITSDSEGNIWVGTNGGGLNRLVCSDDPGREAGKYVIIERFNGRGNGFDEESARIHTMFIDNRERLWVGTENHIFHYSGGSGRVEFEKIKFIPSSRRKSLPGKGPSQELLGARTIFGDSYGGVWMGNSYGLFRFDEDRQCFTGYKPAEDQFASVNIFSAASFRNREKEEIWYSDEGRIYIINPISGQHWQLSNRKDQRTGLQAGWFSCFLADRGGSLWIGSNGYGLSLYSPSSVRFGYPADSITGGDEYLSSVRDLSIRTFFESPGNHGTLWIGSNRGLYKKQAGSSVFHKVELPGTGDYNQVLVYNLCGDSNGFLWIATEIGLIRYNTLDHTSRLFIPESSAAGEADRRVNYVHCHNGEVWILTSNELARLDQESGHFQSFRYKNDPADFYEDAVFPSIYEDPGGILWVAAKNGLHRFDPVSRSFTPVKEMGNQTNSPLRGEIRVILPDPLRPEEYLWLGTALQGFFRYDIQTGDLQGYSKKDGLPNSGVYGMLSDNQGHIWISTNSGLCRFDPGTRKFICFSTDDGLQSNEFNRGAYYKGKDGEMFFGGIKGYNCFHPSEIIPRDFMAPVVITGMHLYDKDHSRVDNESIALQKVNHIKLAHNENHFTVEFASLDFVSPANNEFAYSISSGSDHWVYAGNRKSVTFTELSPGDYTLKIRGTNSDGVWSANEAFLSITIGRPWWGSITALIIYIVLLFYGIYKVRRYEVSRLILKTQMDIASIESRNLKELAQHKSRFFANLSHEFRTPLTLINGPLVRLIDEETDMAKTGIYKMMYASSRRLLQLINQLLDLSRIESGHYSLKAQKKDIITFVEGISMSFLSLANQRDISFEIKTDRRSYDLDVLDSFYFDPDILEKILTNLLTNAIKYTPRKGRVRIILKIVPEKSGTRLYTIFSRRYRNRHSRGQTTFHFRAVLPGR